MRFLRDNMEVTDLRSGVAAAVVGVTVAFVAVVSLKALPVLYAHAVENTFDGTEPAVLVPAQDGMVDFRTRDGRIIRYHRDQKSPDQLAEEARQAQARDRVRAQKRIARQQRNMMFELQRRQHRHQRDLIDELNGR